MLRAYRTVSARAQVEVIIQKSRFIGQCYPITEEAAALRILEETRKKYYDASHNAYAYSLGETGSIARFSDDGEPGGTAGMPMMEALRQKGVTNLVVIVTRYFGGVLLGAGGLVRAYSRAASEAVEAAGIVEMRPCTRFRIVADYARWGSLEGFLRSAGPVEGIAFTERVSATVLIETHRLDGFIKAVADGTDGRVRPEPMGELFWPFPME